MTTYKERVAKRWEGKEIKHTGFGEKHTCAEWARRLDLPRNSLWRYLKNGLSIEEIAEIRKRKYKPENM